MGSSVYIVVAFPVGSRSKPVIFVDTDEKKVERDCNKWLKVNGPDVIIERKVFELDGEPERVS